MKAESDSNRCKLKYGRKPLIAVSVLGLAISLWFAGYIILPRQIIETMVLGQIPPPGDQLYDQSALSGWQSYSKKLTIEYVRFQLNQRFAIDRLSPKVKDLSPAQIGEALFQIESILMTQRDVPHEIKQTPTFLVGLGYCDQVNGVGARILPYFFGSAEVFALVNPQGISTHSIGRYWDESMDQWTYFDIWPGRTVLFVPDKSSADGIRYLYNRKSVTSIATESIQTLSKLYGEGLEHGYTLAKYDHNFLTQLTNQFSGHMKKGPFKSWFRSPVNLPQVEKNPVPALEKTAPHATEIPSHVPLKTWKSFLSWRLNYLWGRRSESDALESIRLPTDSNPLQPYQDANLILLKKIRAQHY
jgi:hypothetical protein